MSNEHEFSHLRNLPLSGLSAFEAAIRLGNFRRAAEEISVTHSAVSHRIRQLEERLGVSLFERHGNRASPTAIGLQYYEVAVAALNALRDANDRIEFGERRLIRLAVMPMLGNTWLAPRLQRFHSQHPKLRFEVHTVRATDDPELLDCDLIIHYGPPPQDGLRSALVFSDQLFAVGAPRLIRALGPFNTATDFVRAPLLRYSLLTWPVWLKSAFGVSVDPQGSYFDDAMTVLEAAREGLGLTVITRVASHELLEQGSLMLAHPHGAGCRDYRVTLADTGQVKPAAIELFQWLTQDSPVSS